MLASLRRSRTVSRSWRAGRTRTAVAGAAVLSLGLAACDGGDEPPQDDTDIEAPADDGAATDAGEQPEAAPAFEDLEAGEVVPGVQLDPPVDDTIPAQAQPTPLGSAYVAALPEQSGAISLNVEFEGGDLDELLAGVDALVASEQAELTSGPEPIEVEGADEAARVELAAPGGGATATGIFAIADGNAISLAVETVDGADADVEAIIDSLVIDTERLQVAGTLQPDEGLTDGGATDAGTEDGATDAATEDAAADPAG